jgi:hypothetical protein
LKTANGINDSGWIVGLGLNGGAPHGYLLIPAPEPGGAGMLTAAASALALARRRPRRDPGH